MDRADKKNMPLEALRGLAAVTVLLWHCMLGFFPQWSGLFPKKWPQEAALNGQVWFGLIYGPAAVTLFFVLSSFVLTRRFLLTGDEQIILRGAIKRWPRLAGPVFVTVLISWALFKLNAYRYAEASAITGSPWLAQFAGAIDEHFRPSLGSAARQGVFRTFFIGEYTYDSSLWTMRYEFIGSFIAFGVALLIGLLPERSRLLRLMIIGIVFALCYYASPFYASFPAGVLLATFLPKEGRKLPSWAVVGSVGVAVYLLGFTGTEIGAFAPLHMLFGYDVVLAEIVASLLLIVAIELAPCAIRKILSGRTASALGTLSFPLYLIHVLVLCSLGCETVLWASTWASGSYPNIFAAVATIVGSLLAAVPLVVVNKRWVQLVTAQSSRMMPSRSMIETREPHFRQPPLQTDAR